MAFPESNSSGSLQLHSKIYVLVSISDPLLRLPGSVAPGSRDTETSSELRVLGAFPRGSLPPSHKPTAPDKPQPKQCPEPRSSAALCLLDPPWDRQVLPNLSMVVSLDFPKSLTFRSHYLCTHLQMFVRLRFYLCRS